VTCLLGIWIAAAEAQDLTIEGHIRQVTDELLPAAIVRGQEPLKMSILDEMKTLHVTGVSIAVIHDGKIESLKSYGAKRLDGDPVTTETPFQAGSISKPIAAIAALRLVQGRRAFPRSEGQRLTHKLEAVREQFHCEESVTLRHLLSHTAGINLHGFDAMAAAISSET
jgi:CubicO group peptidase (beta-lactamase class C family)